MNAECNIKQKCLNSSAVKLHAAIYNLSSEERPWQTKTVCQGLYYITYTTYISKKKLTWLDIRCTVISSQVSFTYYRATFA